MLVKLIGFWIVSFYRFRDRAQFLQQTLYGPLKLDSGGIAAQFLQLAVGLAEQQTSLLRLPRLYRTRAGPPSISLRVRGQSMKDQMA